MSAVQATSPVERTAPAVVITLVHGTFARGAPWTKPDSALRRLWPTTPERSVRFRVFNWSGENSHQARVAASGSLARRLAALTAKYSTASHLVIAHSHGGNVALGAIAQEPLEGKIKAAVCLNTPFLHCELRSLTPLQAALIALNPVTLLLIGSAPFLELYMFPRYPGEFWKPVLITTGLMMAALVPVGIAGYAFWRITERIVNAIESYQARRLAELRSKTDAGCHVLAATVKHDEAYRYLWLLDRITAGTTLGAGIGYFMCLGGLVLILVAGSGGFLTDFNWFPALTRASLVMARYGAIAIGVGVVLFLISAIVMTATCVALRQHKFSYGEHIRDSLFLRIFVKPYPASPVKAELQYFAAPADGLKHSALYGSPEVVQSLAAWFYGLPDASEHMKDGQDVKRAPVTGSI